MIGRNNGARRRTNKPRYRDILIFKFLCVFFSFYQPFGFFFASRHPIIARLDTTPLEDSARILLALLTILQCHRELTTKRNFNFFFLIYKKIKRSFPLCHSMEERIHIDRYIYIYMQVYIYVCICIGQC